MLTLLLCAISQVQYTPETSDLIAYRPLTQGQYVLTLDSAGWHRSSWEAQHNGLLMIADFRQLLSEGDRFTVKTNETVTMDFRHTPEVCTLVLMLAGLIMSRKANG